MATLRVVYPHFQSREPRPLPATEIWALAADARRQILGRVGSEPVDVVRLVARARSARVNGVAFAMHWDLEHAVLNARGELVMGVCEFDPASPESVMVSLNASLEDIPELLRSTAAHELGHAIFEAPAWVTGRAGRADGNAGIRRLNAESAAPAAGSRPMDWREYRANEFMGGFLAPPAIVGRRFASASSTAGIVASRRSKICPGMPSIDTRRNDYLALEAVVVELSDVFGVSPSFMWTRLRRYDLVRGD